MLMKFVCISSFVCVRLKQNSEIAATRPGGLVCKDKDSSATTRIQTAGQHKIWLIWPTTCSLTLWKVYKLQLSRPEQRFLHTLPFLRHFDCYAAMSVC